ncbi:MAG TPA: hypothetical protein DCL41_09505 [Bdellovibrionales bacterium]|nr:hypothetical protein [Bdellovibrionales bacterium]
MILFRLEKKPSSRRDEKSGDELERVIGRFHYNMNDIESIKCGRNHFFVYGAPKALVRKFEKIYFFDGFLSSTEKHPRRNFDSDLECVIELVESGREDEIKRLEGHFITGYYCEKTDTLRVYNDYYGFKALFVGETERYFYVSSRYQLISEQGDFPRDINLRAVEEYLVLGLVFDEKTFFRHTRQLPAGAMLHLENGGCSIQARPERPRDLSYFSCSMKEVAEEFHEILGRSLTSLISRFPAEKMLLTGGSDSRILLGSMTADQRAKIQFYTFQNPEWSPNGNDLEIARQLSECYGLNHKVINRQDQVNFRNQSMAGLAYQNRGHYSDILTGTYGTELVGQGPWKYLPTKFTNFRYDYLRHYNKKLFQPGSESLGDFYDFICERVDSQVGPCKEYQFFLPFFWRSFYSDVYSQHGTYVFISSYEMQNFQKLSPFLMPEVVRFLMKLPSECLVNYRLYGELFKGKLKEWTEVPFNSEMTKYVGHIKVMPKDHKNKNIYYFPFHKYLQKHANHEAFDLDFLQEGGIMGLQWPKDASHIVRFVDYLFWYENAVLLNPKFGEELKEQ